MQESSLKHKSLNRALFDEYCEFLAVKSCMSDFKKAEKYLAIVINDLSINQTNFIFENIHKNICSIQKTIECEDETEPQAQMLDHYRKIAGYEFEKFPNQKFIDAVKNLAPKMIYSADLNEFQYEIIKPKLAIEFARAIALELKSKKKEEKSHV
jgi:hypothetical protein